jgi:hypothetical protein
MKLVTTLGHRLFVLKCACWGPAIRAGIAVLASIVLCGNATAASTRYAVRGLAIGTQLSFDSPLYREYTCSPSDQADGFTWCQKTRSERERRGSYTATYSILHSRDGKVSTSIVLNNRHSSIRMKLRTIYGDIRARSVNRLV